MRLLNPIKTIGRVTKINLFYYCINALQSWLFTTHISSKSWQSQIKKKPYGKPFCWHIHFALFPSVYFAGRAEVL